MKKYTLILVGAILLAACSSPKYTYYFDHFDYNAKKKSSPQKTVVTSEQSVQEPVMAIEEEALTSITREEEVYIAESAPTVATDQSKEEIVSKEETGSNEEVVSREEIVAKINSMSKEERKELKKEVKRFVKENKKEIKEGKAAQAMAGDLKLAAIFGIVGIVLMIVLGDLFWLGTIAILIGLFFLVRYLVNN